MSKKRILWVSEASFLNTGFSVLTKEILERLYKTDKYEIAELGCYAKTHDPRVYDIPWAFYGGIPDENNVIAQQKYNSSVFGQFGEAVFEQVCLDFKPDIVVDVRDWWMCLKNGNVWMADGSVKEIQNISIGDKVITHTGNIQSVTGKFSRNFKGKMVKIKPSILALPIDMTYNHPVLSMKQTKNRMLPKNMDDAKFVQAEEIEKGDYLFFPLPKYKIEESNLTKDQLFALGFFVAEGCYLKHKNIKDGIQITANVKEKQIVESVLKSLSSLVNDSVIHNTSNDNKSCTVGRIGSKSLANKLYEWFGEYANKKELPQWVMSLPYWQKHFFLQGLIVGDGCCNLETNRGAYYTTSKQLALQTWTMMQSSFVPCSLHKGTTKLNGKIFERYIISANSDKYLFKAWEELYTKGSLDSLPVDYNRWLSKNETDYVLLTVNSIDTYKDNCEVHNFEVENEHTYVCNFAMHNCEYQLKSPFRNRFKLIWMPTVDGEPQRLEWLDSYSRADMILTYSEYGKQVLEREAPDKVKVFDVVRPGVNHDMYRPLDKKELRKVFGISPDSKIIMTVMRNQRRKLFPDLIETFADYIKKCVKENNADLAANTYLYLHTSYPDVGFDIARHIMQSGIGHRVLTTYCCEACKNYYPDFFQTELTVCKICGALAAHLPNTQLGLTREQLVNIINLGDIYVQYSICEGLGMPVAEGKACGIPAMGIEYSATAEQVKAPGCIPVKVGKFFYEAVIETEQKRSLPDQQDAVDKLYWFFNLSEAERHHMGVLAREDAITNYSFDRASYIFEKAIDSLEIQNSWDAPASFAPMNLNVPNAQNSADLVDWCIDNIVGMPELKSTYWRSDLIKALNVGFVIDRGGRQPMTHQDLIFSFERMAKNHNFWESVRTKSFTENNKVKWELV